MQKESPNPCHGATLSTCTIHIYYQFISIHSFDARIAWICFDTGAVEQGVRDLHPGTWDLGNSHHHHRLLWSCPPRPVASVLSCSSWRYRKSCRVFRPMSKLFDVSVLSFRVFCEYSHPPRLSRFHQKDGRGHSMGFSTFHRLQLH